jgi:hypothetical protein
MKTTKCTVSEQMISENNSELFTSLTEPKASPARPRHKGTADYNLCLGFGGVWCGQ